jgi:hypothetical protein
MDLLVLNLVAGLVVSVGVFLATREDKLAEGPVAALGMSGARSVRVPELVACLADHQAQLAALREEAALTTAALARVSGEHEELQRQVTGLMNALKTRERKT